MKNYQNLHCYQVVHKKVHSLRLAYRKPISKIISPGQGIPGSERSVENSYFVQVLEKKKKENGMKKYGLQTNALNEQSREFFLMSMA